MSGVFKATMAASLLLGGCMLVMAGQYGDEAKEAVEANGFTDVVPQGRAWWGCGKRDVISNLFTAKAPNGKAVEIVACSGLFWKAFTVRIRKVA